MVAIWNPVDKNPVITLSGGNLTATNTSGTGANHSAVRASQAISSTLKQYFEVTVSGTQGGGTIPGNGMGVGVMNGAAAISNYLAATNGAGWHSRVSGSNAQTVLNAVFAGAYTSPNNADVIRVAIDRANNKVWWARNNNTWSGSAVWMGSGGTTDDPATGTGGLGISTVTGTVYPAWSSPFTNDVATLNAGATAFAFAAPSGFISLNSTPATSTNTGWSTTDRTSGAVPSNNNLTLSVGGGDGGRGADGQSAGKAYFEVTCTTWAGSRGFIGLATSTTTLSGIATNLGGAIAMTENTGTVWINASNFVSFGARSNGDILGIAFDMTARLVWFRIAPSGNWNNSGTANPATGAGGFSTAAFAGGTIFMPLGSSVNGGTVVTANFGDSAFSGAVPSGFNAGWPVAPIGSGGAAVAQARAMVLA